MESDILIDAWKRLLTDPGKPWVLFEHGTCVVLTAPGEDLAAQATEILGVFGPVHAGGPAGDFRVIEVEGVEGWVVTGHHPDVLTYVAPDEPGGQDHLSVGLCGRAKRHQDGTEPHVVHVEDRREAAGSE
ncbi:hypothetical protein [Streptomyces sp. NPDC059575]|uniref:hypothetical protein n=1 Tax=Streptomyces sp. NPDC059575 TaxID=3346872 RepID=UPI0036C74B9F